MQNDVPETQENGKDLEKETETEETKKDADGGQTMHAEDEKVGPFLRHRHEWRVVLEDGGRS